MKITDSESGITRTIDLNSVFISFSDVDDSFYILPKGTKESLACVFSGHADTKFFGYLRMLQHYLDTNNIDLLLGTPIKLEAGHLTFDSLLDFFCFMELFSDEFLSFKPSLYMMCEDR